MSHIKPINITVGSTGRSLSELYKELEVVNFKSLDPKSRTGRDGVTEKYNDFKLKGKWASREESQDFHNSLITDQYTLFQSEMKWLLICGQCLGLNPVIGILEKDASKMKFKFLSWRFLYSFLLCFLQAIAVILCLYRLYKTVVSIKLLAFFSFYASTGFNTFLFIRIAMKWPALLKDVYNSSLNEYIDMNLKFKCRITMGILLILPLVEHILSLLSNLSRTLECYEDQGNLYEAYIEISFPWIFKAGIPYSMPLAIIIQFVNFACTINWSYSDFFIVCISFYLTSILKKINEKLIASREKCLPPAFWRELREDYTRAGRLVRKFDNAISGIIFTSFASNLFFICLQLFNVLSNGLKPKASVECSNFPSGSNGGYFNVVYFTFSLAFVLARFLAVSLITAGIHTASLVPAPALYDIPSPIYSNEVQRFIEQVHGDTVALSGLQFFYITKSLVLTVASTIVTYELVLLQFNGEEMVQ